MRISGTARRVASASALLFAAVATTATSNAVCTLGNSEIAGPRIRVSEGAPLQVLLRVAATGAAARSEFARGNVQGTISAPAGTGDAELTLSLLGCTGRSERSEGISLMEGGTHRFFLPLEDTSACLKASGQATFALRLLASRGSPEIAWKAEASAIAYDQLPKCPQSKGSSVSLEVLP